jgi:ABC-type transport system involved in multi-copper enzyme maturation permease subunit
MSGRWGLGPVFAYEWLTTSRRWQVYAGRAAFVGLLLVALTGAWAAKLAGQPPATTRAMAQVGRAFFGAIVFSQITLALLAAPAATAGAVCLDKGRGNLALLLITGLSDAELVLGKLAARLVPVVGLVGCALPVLALGSLLGGIDPASLAGALAVTVAVATLCAAIAFAFSVWGTKPHEVLLATLAVETIWLLAVPVWELFVWLRGLPKPPRWVLSAHPYILAFAPYDRPGSVDLRDYVGFVTGALGISAALAAVSIARLRAVVVGQADRGARRRASGWWDGRPPALERNPALWYEWHRRRPSPWIRGLVRLYFGLAVAFSLVAIDDSLRPATPLRGWLSAYVAAFVAALGVPLLLVAAATALVEERVRGSLDVLLTTPLSTPSVVWAKWWGVFREAPRLLFLPAVVVVPLEWASGDWLVAWLVVLNLVVACAAWMSLGLALSTWIPSVGRSVATAVALYTLIGLGWPMLAMTLWGGYQGGYQGAGYGLSMISPFYAVFYLTFGIAEPRYLEHLVGWGLGWAAFQAVAAVALLGATLATFNPCLGRIPERARRVAAKKDEARSALA